MNHVCKSAWNQGSGTFQVASELAHHGGGQGSSKKNAVPAMRHIAAAALLCATAGAAAAASLGSVDTLYRLDSDGNVYGYFSGLTTSASDLAWDGANLVVTGSIAAAQSGAPTLLVNGIPSVTNDGTITGGMGSGSASGFIEAIHIQSGTTLGTLTNNGLINGAAYAIYNDRGTISNLNNTGSMLSAGIFNNGAITNLNNSGTISGVFTNSTNGNIATLTNSGTLSGNFNNNGVIGDLSGTGRMVGNLSNNGTLGVSSAVSITGNYTQSANATLSIGVTDSASTTLSGVVSETGYGRLVVSGDAKITSGASIVLRSVSGNYGFAAGQRFVVIDAAGAGTNYNASSLNYSLSGASAANLTITGSSVALSNGNTDLVLSLSAPGGTTTSPTTSTITYASRPNASNALAGLLNYSGIRDAALLNLYNATRFAVSSGSQTSNSRVGTQLEPLKTPAASVTATTESLGVVGSHVDGLRVAQNQGTSGVATGEKASELSAWGQFFGGHARQGARQDVDGYKSNYGGLVLGADRTVNDQWMAGGALSYAHTAIDSLDYTAANSVGVNSYGLIGYASYTGSPWYLNLQVGLTQHRYSTTRVVSMTGYSGVANGNFRGQQYVAKAEVGYPLAFNGVTLTPVAGLTYSRLEQDGYTETGGNGAALIVGSTRTDSVQSALGARLDKSYQTSYGTLVPQVKAQWVHEYKRGRQGILAQFSADTTGETSFATYAATPVSDFVDLSVGVTLVRAQNLSISARYQLQLGAGFVSNSGILRLQKQF